MKKPAMIEDDCIVFPSMGVIGAHYCTIHGEVELSQIFQCPCEVEEYMFFRRLRGEPYCLYSAETLDRDKYFMGLNAYMGQLIGLLSPDVLAKVKVSAS